MLITIISRVLHALLGLGEQVCGNKSLKEPRAAGTYFFQIGFSLSSFGYDWLISEVKLK